MFSKWRMTHLAWLPLAFLAVSAPGCASCAGTGQGMLGLMPGAINDPGNRSLRRAILQYGLDQFCQQMTTHDAPLTLAADAPNIGRFYPRQCAQKQLDNGDLVISFSGEGYAFTNVSKKVSFTSSGTVEYDQDFLMDGSTMYAYFRTKNVQQSGFTTKLIEQPIASLVNSMSPMADQMGKQLLSTQLAAGFTVIRDSSGSAQFSIGIIDKGKKPVQPFDVHGDGRITYEDARVEVHQNERDFLGPIAVEDDGRALYITATVDGLPIDVLVMDRNLGDQSIGYYLSYAAIGPLAGQPLLSDVAQPGVQYKRTFAAPKGQYYVIFDNSGSAGSVAPPNNPLDDRVATVSYVVQIGDAP
jgi:hypothetical protein